MYINKMIFCCLLLSVHQFSFAGNKDTIKVIELMEMAKAEQQNGQLKNSESYYKKAEHLADVLNYDNGKLAVAGNYSTFLFQQLRYDEALAYAKEALSISLRSGNKLKAAASYNNIALQYQAKGKLDIAAKNFLASLSILTKLKSQDLGILKDRRKYLNNLSALFLDLNDLDKGLYYAKESLRIAKKLKDTLAIGNSLVNIMVAEVLTGHLQEAKKHGLAYLQISRLYKDVAMEIKALNNLGDLYRRLNQYQDAIISYRKAIELIDGNLPGNLVYSLTGISEVYLQKGEFGKADHYFEKANLIAKKELPVPQLIEFYRSGAKIKEANGNYQYALKLQKQYELLNDSLLNNRMQESIRELEVKYQIAQNREQLAERDLKIVAQEAEIARKNKWFILALSLLLFMMFSFFFRRRLNQQNKNLKEGEQRKQLLLAQLAGEERERSRTAKELHDGVASIIAAAKLQVNACEGSYLPDTSFKEVDQLLESAIQEIRNISHNLAPELILREGLSCAVKAYCSRMSRQKLQLSCYIMGNYSDLRSKSQLTIYRIIQEAVSNMIKHANATEGLVQIIREESRITITIEDNGKGFDVNKVIQNGIGFSNLNSRVNLLDGVFDIRSCVGKGTSIFIELEVQSQSTIKTKNSPHIQTYSTQFT